MAIALAAVLSLFHLKLPHLIYGGSVSLHTLPIFIVALRNGARTGVLAGVCYGVVNFLMSPYLVHPVQLLLDYPVAFGTLGIAGAVGAARSRPWLAALAVALASSARLAAHVLSGIVYFGQLAPAGTPAWKYSVVYNCSYMVPETVIACAATALLMRRTPLVSRGGAGPQQPTRGTRRD